jgi:AraC family transcriptional regulator of adaptative response/methylated-DNA-[protein]-cysteine methyltransferase
MPPKGKNVNMSTRNEQRALATVADPRWAAVTSRDPSAGFFYSVDTTGVYCRPSCGARTPRPENVRFHDSAAAARQAGFRPCLRCRPEEPPRADRHADAMARVCRFIEAAAEAPTLDQLAQHAGMSPHYLHRVFKAIVGVTPKAYADAHRTRRVREELGRGGPITAAIYEAGYNSNGRFYAASNDVLGMTPSRFRAGGADTTIRFAVGQCSLGAILVAASERGVCAILLGDDPDVLARDLQDRFPRAELVGGDRTFERLVAQVVGLVEMPGTGVDLPLDVRGTAFQQRVWQALRSIPAGSTVTYEELARRIGAPRSARAVAQACGANPLAVAIPCHRVIRRDGALSGYRWGVARKQALLEREGSR